MILNCIFYSNRTKSKQIVRTVPFPLHRLSNEEPQNRWCAASNDLNCARSLLISFDDCPRWWFPCPSICFLSSLEQRNREDSGPGCLNPIILLLGLRLNWGPESSTPILLHVHVLNHGWRFHQCSLLTWGQNLIQKFVLLHLSIGLYVIIDKNHRTDGAQQVILIQIECWADHSTLAETGRPCFSLATTSTDLPAWRSSGMFELVLSGEMQSLKSSLYLPPLELLQFDEQTAP